MLHLAIGWCRDEWGSGPEYPKVLGEPAHQSHLLRTGLQRGDLFLAHLRADGFGTQGCLIAHRLTGLWERGRTRLRGGQSRYAAKTMANRANGNVGGHLRQKEAFAAVQLDTLDLTACCSAHFMSKQPALASSCRSDDSASTRKVKLVITTTSWRGKTKL